MPSAAFVSDVLRVNCTSINLVMMNTFMHHTPPRILRERSGSVVECLTPDRRAAGLSFTGVTALWSLSKTHLS